MSEGLTISEAKRLGFPLVYGLADAEGIFYVGQTKSPRRRFQAHRECAHSNHLLSARVRGAGADLRVIILRENPPNLLEAERDEMRARTGLVNIVGADDARWAAHYPVPWAAGAGVLAPSAMMMQRVRPVVKPEIRKMMWKMEPHERCFYELRLLADMHPIVRRRFKRWLTIALPKMMACMQDAYGPI